MHTQALCQLQIPGSSWTDNLQIPTPVTNTTNNKNASNTSSAKRRESQHHISDRCILPGRPNCTAMGLWHIDCFQVSKQY
jgi:hypothetical protein